MSRSCSPSSPAAQALRRGRRSAQSLRILALGIALALGAGRSPQAFAGDVLAEISVHGTQRPGAIHGEMFVFPENVRDYSARSFHGWSFRQELGDDRVRVLEIARVRTPGAYILATDLFADGHLSTMAHTVLMVFPRQVADPYALREDATGTLSLAAPDGSVLHVDGRSGALLPTADFSLSPQGAPGTPPRLYHRGLRLEISAVGKNPFLTGTQARFIDASGTLCTTTTDDLFAYGTKRESDVFRFDSDAALYGYLAARCPGLALPAAAPRTVALGGRAVQPGRTGFAMPATPVAPAQDTVREPRGPGNGRWHGVLDTLADILSNRR